MSDFQYVFYSIPNQHEVVEGFPDRDPDFMAEAYLIWLKAHLSRARIFYVAQYRNHYNLVWNGFCAENDISNEESLSYHESDRLFWLWDEKEQASGLLMHEQFQDHALEQIEIMYNGHIRPDPNDSDSIGYTAQKMLLEMRLRELHPSFMRRYIDEWWFNTQINNPADMVSNLRRAPYGEYLKSLHWRRVKGALMIIHCARCMSDQCCGLDGYWNDDRFLHVHHMSYKNRGNERFADLRLLCHMCHERFHKRGLEAVFSHPEVPYSVMQ